MPTDNISQTLKESYAQANSADVYLETLEVFSDFSGEVPYKGTQVGSFDEFYGLTVDFEDDTEDYLIDTGILTA